MSADIGGVGISTPEVEFRIEVSANGVGVRIPTSIVEFRVEEWIDFGR